MGYLRVLVASIVLLAASGGITLAHTDITASDVHDMIVAGEDFILLDVREYSEFCQNLFHIQDAVNLPWASEILHARLDELPVDAKIVVVCASGNRSDLAATYLDGQGYTNVYDMLGGMSMWTWEKEACDAAPVLGLGKGESTLEMNWTPMDAPQDYDLLRGLVESISSSLFVVNLGPTDCLANDSPFTYRSEFAGSDPETLRFYLVRQVSGSWGQSSADKQRTTVSGSCDAPNP